MLLSYNPILSDARNSKPVTIDFHAPETTRLKISETDRPREIAYGTVSATQNTTIQLMESATFTAPVSLQARNS